MLQTADHPSSIDRSGPDAPEPTRSSAISDGNLFLRTGTVDGPDAAAALTPRAAVRHVSDAVLAWRDMVHEQGAARFVAWLTPPDLGHVWVELVRSGDGISARLRASDEDVQSVLETHEPELRQALAESGIELHELDVSGRSSGESAFGHPQPDSTEHDDAGPPACDPPTTPRPRTASAARVVDVRA